MRIFTGSNNHIGGYDEGQRNVFLTGKYGVHLESPGTYNYASNNYIGTIDGDSLPGGGMGRSVSSYSMATLLASCRII